MKRTHRLLLASLTVVMLAVALVLVAAWGQPSLAEDEVIYVDAAADPGGDGASWGTAFADLQDALEAAADAAADAAPVEIWVASGTYTPTLKLAPEDDRTATFQMANGVAIYGGFAGGETELGQRNWAANPTILSGDIGTVGDPADNSFHVFYNTGGLDDTAILDGFTITGGNADGEIPHNAGGGMYNGSSSPTLANLNFAGNSASDEGGGMLNDSSAPTLTGCIFSANTADAGGGIHNSSSSPTLTNVTFAGNEANSGGGMHNNESSPVLVNCTFWDNSAQGKGGGMRNKSNSLPTLTNCTFYGNTATDGGAIQNHESSAPTLTNCTFYGNTATDGGAMHNLESSSPTLTNCILWGDSHPEIHNSSDGSSANVTFSDIEGSSPDPLTGNISADPRFADPDSGNFHLLPGSPCIDAGTEAAPSLPDEDFEGDPRSMDGDGDGAATPDMGVDETWPPVYLPLMLRDY